MTDKGESIGDEEEESTRVNGEESTKKPTAWSRRTIMFDLPYWKVKMMRTYKLYVRNPIRPEACIAMRYITEEAIMYCMEYMPDGRMGSHKRGRDLFMDDDDEWSSEYPLDKKGTNHFLDPVNYEQARRWVLESYDDIDEWKDYTYESWRTSLTPELDVELEKIRNISIAEPEIVSSDIDNDPVVQVCGKDTKGRTRAYGLNVSQEEVLSSYHLRDLLLQEKTARFTLEEDLVHVKDKLTTMDQKLSSLAAGRQGTSGSVTFNATKSPSSMRPSSPIALLGKERPCELLSFTGKIVASGRSNGDSHSAVYNIIIDDVTYNPDIDSVDSDPSLSSLNDVELGTTIVIFFNSANGALWFHCRSQARIKEEGKGEKFMMLGIMETKRRTNLYEGIGEEVQWKDMSSTSFIDPLPVIELVCQLLNKDAFRPLSDMDRVKIKKTLRGMKVEVTHQGNLKNMRRKYRVIGLTVQAMRDLTFDSLLADESGTITSVVQHFQEAYDIVLQHPHWPCLQVGNQQRPNYLPMEVCKIVERQRYSKSLSEKQVTSLLKVTCQRPYDRERDIVKAVHHNDYDEDPYAKEFGLKINNKLAAIEARILPTPVIYNKGLLLEGYCYPCSFRLKKAFRKIHVRLTIELEKKFSGKDHEESCSYEDLHLLEEIRQFLPAIKATKVVL
ncbi:hypothetical protein GIB67_025996 [Kingdonia uniflora]|uniref:PAZ domain-containing protein n=1 Tax=Kingdonia uniflora TaxID=39325 RepID=A0A7J7M2T2_9MAGN|nr:hypothetical protein GIB67_025996 [Kingdonia uniflora]